MTVADHIQKVLKPNFGAAWEEVGADFEKEETFALASVRTLEGNLGGAWPHYWLSALLSHLACFLWGERNSYAFCANMNLVTIATLVLASTGYLTRLSMVFRLALLL